VIFIYTHVVWYFVEPVLNQLPYGSSIFVTKAKYFTPAICNPMKNKLLLILFIAISFGLNAQNVGINTTGANPSINAILDLNTGNSNNLGLIIPHVTLGTSLTIFSPPIANAPTIKDTGMFVYNMNGAQAVGYYYWNGTTWVNVSASTNAWLLTGNSGTTWGTNFIGTTDNNPLAFRVNNIESGWIDTKSAVYLGYQAGLQDNPTNSNQNTGIGYQSLKNTTANDNTAIGYQSLSTNTTGTYNTAIGANANTSTNNLTNATAIGANTTVGESNAVVIGNNANVGIGTSTPNTGAALDVTSSTQGILIPRMASNPASTVTSLMYYNTTTNCFMFYNGTTWQSMFCACSTPPNTPAIPSGPATFCLGGTGTYTVAAVSGAIYYTWSVPSGATITSGQGTTSINVMFGSTSGTISVTATNSCGISPASTLTVTNGAPVITGQPTNPSGICFGNGTATFTVTATGGGLTYQWQEFISSWNNITNGGVYSGANTASLIITNPPVTMNGYQYRCVVSGTCTPAATSNAATLTVYQTYLPITLTNSQVTATAANLQVKLTVNSTTYSAYESSGLQNVEFTTGPGGTGTVLQAWIESGATSASAATVYWVNLGSSTIAASGGTLTIYMDFMATTVMSAAGPTGAAPQLFGGANYATTYGQYDNGASVFTFYDNFSGSSLSAKWTSYSSGSGTLVVSNGLTITSATGGNQANVISSVSNYAPPIIAESDVQGSSPQSGARSYMPGLISNTATTEGVNIADATGASPTTSYLCFSNGRSALVEYSWLQGNSTAGSPYSDYNRYQTYTAGYNIYSLIYNPTANFLYFNYALAATGIATYSPTGSLYFALGIEDDGATVSTTLNSYWTRIRQYPPANVLPTAALGAILCP